LQRYLFEVAYLGTNYHGWQIQPNAITVQEVLNKCLSTMLKTTVNISGSGRTDTGVHCRQQFFHADLAAEINLTDLMYKLNSMLPFDIGISSIKAVKDDAHARYDATSRSYAYHINLKKDPFSKELSYYYPKSLEIENMNKAAALLCGDALDCEAFSKVKTSVNNFICTISEAYWEIHGDKLIFNITANRFLRGMVRAVVGTLLDVGLGKISVEEMKDIINSKDRRKAGSAAPAHGLYLCKVTYPKNIYK
jgi:tRNA pseudouridine38-40 synthase